MSTEPKQLQYLRLSSRERTHSTPSSAALMITESLSIISTQLHSAFTVSAGLNLHGSWHFMRPMSERESAQLG